MASVFLFVFFLLSHFVLLLSAQEEMIYTKRCPPFHCGHLGRIGFPFANNTYPECGVFTVDCRDDHYPTIQLEDGGRPYEVLNISESNTMSSMRIFDIEFREQLKFGRCESLTNLTFPYSSFISFEIATPNQTFFKCNRTPDIPPPTNFFKMSCMNYYDIYFSNSSDSFPTSLSGCSIIQLPKNLSLDHPPSPGDDDLFSFLTSEFDLGVRVSEDCYKCYQREGQCKPDDNGELSCYEREKGSNKMKRRIALGEISLQSNFLSILFHLVVIYCILDAYIATPFLLRPSVTIEKNIVLLWFGLVTLACKKRRYI
ncbi:LEAF RUST 10 DISEASE-RESISTANCE LOCUS RECEPTOR-LIKE PROTEIN KINASE-like 1.1 [Alnus glutinosa]|uniref:LEAF RUST 10 DISEASE-RESISTANCE LOCUS RECEPTOR-LIKE PROTEIN KINASE-like 1.1 n=1 Tax=Alnus glutinosa TaxID=3517 RepID=UPI002D7A01A8|nr:LEAF RUST 10 DISEASE-RESISTANCE LOCUS RECEPTOR-LIKE PROTEIN KINASE-like 1.1 [Alnus glutinosa]